LLSSIRCTGFSAVYWNHHGTKNFGSPDSPQYHSLGSVSAQSDGLEVSDDQAPTFTEERNPAIAFN
jgi:hypothetical protein